MILGGDIGGTSTRMAWFEIVDGRPRVVVSERFLSGEHPGLAEIVQTFVARHPRPIEGAAFGIAGPVRDGRAVTPNLPWVVDAAGLAALLGLPSVALINDLAANAHGIPVLEADDLVTLQAGVEGQGGAIAVISAGTGLGQAGAIRDSTGFRVLPSEGGHADFAPRTEIEIELLNYLRERFGHVSIERVVSGQGLVNIYDFLTATERADEPATVSADIATGDRAAAISRAGQSGASRRCAMALDIFVGVYGASAGNLGLTLLATGGVYLGGGIAPRLLANLQSGRFIEAFNAKGRMTAVVAAMPVKVIQNDQTALLGAGRYAALQAGLIDS